MKGDILKILICPACHSDRPLTLNVINKIDNDIITGSLQCQDCHTVFEIEDSVPNLLTSDYSRSVQNAFSIQWQMRAKGSLAEKKTLYGKSFKTRIEELENVFQEILTNDESDIWYLEVGSGSGEYIFGLAEKYPAVNFVAMDFSESIRMNAISSPGLSNLYFVRGDANNPPFKQSKFSAVSALGVLHHTRDTSAAFDAAANMVKDGGSLCVWIYPHLSDLAKYYPRLLRWFFRYFYYTRDYIFLGSGHRLPKKLLAFLIKLYVSPFRLMGKDFFNSMVFIMFDGLVPKYQHRHTVREIKQWYQKNGFAVPRHLNGLFISQKMEKRS
ncbi:MAG: methyltransferase domain-containing protein [Candidatus Aminicenantes bacterium]|nr:MAG: methyltransferase domain-containing protein [Candidatus Aminicenantes bacterium]